MKINLLVLTPLLRAAVDRYGEEAAQIVEVSEPSQVAMEAVEMVQFGHTHIVDDVCSEENEFAAERFEESAVLLLCAARKLRDRVKK